MTSILPMDVDRPQWLQAVVYVAYPGDGSCAGYQAAGFPLPFRFG